MNSIANDSQKEKYLNTGISGAQIGCLCITEPNAGSDVKAMRTTAVKQGDVYILMVQKHL